jgi:FKBP-type peptidyl-prolyl cis-trans isomerase 2
MTFSESKRLENILAGIEKLQKQTRDIAAKDALGRAKSELIRLFNSQT